jgi:hypothetical protein
MRDSHRGRTRPDSRSYFVFVVDTVIQPQHSPAPLAVSPGVRAGRAAR